MSSSGGFLISLRREWHFDITLRASDVRVTADDIATTGEHTFSSRVWTQDWPFVDVSKQQLGLLFLFMLWPVGPACPRLVPMHQTASLCAVVLCLSHFAWLRARGVFGVAREGPGKDVPGRGVPAAWVV